MKKLEFETSKGRFAIKDLNFIPLDCNGIKLSEITEEQASEIVGYSYSKKVWLTEKYLEREYLNGNNAIESLHSLLKSKGIHLFENPHNDCEDKDFKWFHDELTFYNPYIFKL